MKSNNSNKFTDIYRGISQKTPESRLFKFNSEIEEGLITFKKGLETFGKMWDDYDTFAEQIKNILQDKNLTDEAAIHQMKILLI